MDKKFSFSADMTEIVAQGDERGNLVSTSYNATMAKASFQESANVWI